MSRGADKERDGSEKLGMTSSHGRAKCGTGRRATKGPEWGQTGAGNVGGTLCQVHGCLTTKLYT